MIQPRKIPLYAERIFIGNNVRVASNVTFITHNVIHNMLRQHRTKIVVQIRLLSFAKHADLSIDCPNLPQEY